LGGAAGFAAVGAAFDTAVFGVLGTAAGEGAFGSPVLGCAEAAGFKSTLRTKSAM
jgi:hypothetical protein